MIIIIITAVIAMDIHIVALKSSWKLDAKLGGKHHNTHGNILQDRELKQPFSQALSSSIPHECSWGREEEEALIIGE